MGAESKQTPPGGAPVDELDDEAEPTTSGLALKPKPPVFDDDEDEAEEHTELQMDAELVARARHRLLFGRAKPAGAPDAKPGVPDAKPVSTTAAVGPPKPSIAPPKPSIPPPGILAAPGIPRRLPTPPPVSAPTAPPRPAPGAPGPLLSPNATPGIARRLPTPPPGSIQPPHGAGPGPSLRAPTPSPVASPGRARSSTIIGTGPSAGPGAAPRAPTPTPAPSSPLQTPSAFSAAADVSQSRRAMANESGLVPAPATTQTASDEDDFVINPQTTELPVPAAGESADLLAGIPTLASDSAITDENPAAGPVEVPTAFAPSPDASGTVDPNAVPSAFAPPATGDAWSQPNASVSRSGNTGVTNRNRAKRTAIEYAAITIASLAILWAIWLVLFYRR